MKAIQADADGALSVAELPDPPPSPGQCLIKVICAPVNPADRMQVAGTYIVQKEPPYVPGVVGVGKVVATNEAGLMGRFLKGKKVVFAPGPDLPGTWAQRAVAPVSLCLPLPKGLSPEEGVNLLANAMTATALIEETKAFGSPALVLTAAAGELGRMVNAVAGDRGVEVVSVVRNEEQASGLRGAGAKHVVVSGTADFAEALAAAVQATGAKFAGDAVAGGMVADLMEALPDGAKILCYGRLSGENASFDVMRYLVGKHVTVAGFDLGAWLESRSKLAQLKMVKLATQVLKSGHKTKVKDRVDLAELVSDFAELGRRQTNGKTIVFPNGVPR